MLAFFRRVLVLLHDLGIQIVSFHVDYKGIVFVKYACGGRNRFFFLFICSESGIIHLRNDSVCPHML